MEEEEKKAIETVLEEYHRCIGCRYVELHSDDLKTLLNLIEKQNNRLEQLEKENKNLDNLAKTMMNNYTKALEDTVKHDYIPKSVIMEKILKHKFFAPEYMNEVVAIEDIEELLGEEL